MYDHRTRQSPQGHELRPDHRVAGVAARNVWKIETYIADAEKEGDSELAEWFRKIQENSKLAGAQGKQLLAKRLTAEET